VISKKAMKPVLQFLAILTFLIAFTFDKSSAKNIAHPNIIASTEITSANGAFSPDNDSLADLIDLRYKIALDRLKFQASSLKEYARSHHFNTDYCFLVDMSLPSGKKRFFVYNMKKDSLEYSSMVAHGYGSAPRFANEPLQFSNVPNSAMTSLGKYKIGYSYFGAFGLAYKLYGLDSSNSNAFERAIVLHSYTSVPESETYPNLICESAGCPMVNSSFLATLGKYIKASPKPILLWIYN
jgi:hypothetical protein